MVQKILTIILILSHTSAVAASTSLYEETLVPTSGLLLRWRGEKSVPCRKLVEVFLTELRALASDRIIELEAMGEQTSSSQSVSDLRPLDMQCVSHGVQISEDENSLLLRYLEKASGFDALDWVPFQERYLRASKISLAPRPPLSPTSATPVAMSVAEDKPSARVPLLQRWWFWGIVAGAVGGGIYALTQSQSNTSNVDVEIQ